MPQLALGLGTLSHLIKDWPGMKYWTTGIILCLRGQVEHGKHWETIKIKNDWNECTEQVSAGIRLGPL